MMGLFVRIEPILKTCSVLILFLLKCHAMQLSFCDGDTLVTLKDSECPGGINFGVRKPDCVCLNGIYRMWLDNCVLFDGFMQDGCSNLTQVEWTVMGLRFSGKMDSFEKSTVAIYSKDDSDDQPWLSHGIGTNRSTRSDNFYTINGDAYMMVSDLDENLKYICVEKKLKPEDNICRHYKEDEDTGENWSENDVVIRIVVTKKCKRLPGFKRIALAPQSCYGALQKEDSECTLSCVKKPSMFKDYVDPLDNLEMANTNDSDNSIFRRSFDADVNTNTVEDGSDEIITLGNGITVGDSRKIEFTDNFLQLPISFDNIDESNYSTLTMTQQQEANNFFLNRKLNHYSKLRQVGYIQPNDLRQVKPQRTFELLEIVRDISKRTCADRFVSSLFIDQAVDLFVILHKGRNYRYTEDLEEDDFAWIKKILTTCYIDTKELQLMTEENQFSRNCEDLQKVKGVCDPNNCTDLTLTETHGGFGEFHFVVEAVWDLIDLVQIVCFPSFTESYRMFHQWEQASEKLFTREIRKLWHNPSMSGKVYQNLLTPSAQVDMYNLEMCVEGAYALNPSLTRLSRPNEPRRYFRRKKRDVKKQEEPIKRYDVFCRKTEKQFEYAC